MCLSASVCVRAACVYVRMCVHLRACMCAYACLSIRMYVCTHECICGGCGVLAGLHNKDTPESQGSFFLFPPSLTFLNSTVQEHMKYKTQSHAVCVL